MMHANDRHEHGEHFGGDAHDFLFKLPGLDPLVVEAFPITMHLHGTQGKAFFRLLKNLDLHPGQMICGRIIEVKEGLSQRELAGYVHIKPATVTVMLQKMEKSGLITRIPDEEDRRITRIYLTEQGKTANRQAAEVMRDLLMSTFGRLTPDQLRAYIETTEQLIALTNQYQIEQKTDVINNDVM
jgi:DNA-binding MarR family transcriptional regulator